MHHDSRRGGADSQADDEQLDNEPMEEAVHSIPYDCRPDDFGSFGKLHQAHRARSQASLPSSLVGTGPNGTRTLLMGWFGLDEPTSAGYNTKSESKEKTIDGDVLPMRATNPADLEDPYQHCPAVPHYRIPTAEDPDWETRSENSVF